MPALKEHLVLQRHELRREINIVLVRIVKALDLRPERVYLLGAALLDIAEGGQVIDQLTVFEHRHLKLHRAEVAHGLLLPAVVRVAYLKRLRVVNGLVVHADIVCLGHAALPVEEAVHLLEAGVRDLADVFAELDLRDDLAVRFFDGTELIHAAEHRGAFGGYQSLADAEGIDLCALTDKLGNEALVKGVRDGDGAARPAGVVEHFARALGEIGHVAGVQTDAALGDAHGAEHLVERADGVGYAGLEGVEGVHEQDGVIRIGLAVADEGVILGVEHLHP